MLMFYRNIVAEDALPFFTDTQPAYHPGHFVRPSVTLSALSNALLNAQVQALTAAVLQPATCNLVMAGRDAAPSPVAPKSASPPSRLDITRLPFS
jgi:hypothetical protein